MSVQLKQDILGGQFKAGQWVEAVEATNLPDNPDGKQYWLLQGKDFYGTAWKHHMCGYLITPDEVC